MGRVDSAKYFKIVRDFLEGNITEETAIQIIDKEIKRHFGSGDYYDPEFKALVSNLSESFIRELFLNQPSLNQLSLFTLFLNMLSYSGDEADALLGEHRLFHRGGGLRNIPGQWETSKLGKISALAEAPIIYMRRSSDLLNINHGFGPPAPWFEYRDIIVPKTPERGVMYLFDCGRYLLTTIGLAVGLSYVQSGCFCQLSLTSIDGVSTWRVPWDQILVDLAEEYYGLTLPASITHAHEFGSSTRIYRIIWFTVHPTGHSDGALIKLYSRIFSPRTSLFYVYQKGEYPEIANPLYKRNNVLRSLYSSGLVQHER